MLTGLASVYMRFALNLGNGGPCADPRSMAELAALAEESGWDGVLLEDYRVYQNRTGTPTYDPFVCLAAMAMRTRRIRLGTMVTPLPRRRVAKLAAEMVALANLGEQTDTRTRAEMVDEGLEVLVGLWCGEPFNYRGRHFNVTDVMLLPRPVQAPRIPIWIGGQYPKPGPVSVQRAGMARACSFQRATHRARLRSATGPRKT